MDFAEAVDKGGAVFIMAMVVFVVTVGAWKQWWVPGWLYKQEREEKIAALDKLDRALDATQGAAHVAVDAVEERKRSRRA